jgi:hypothetical protein
MNTIPVYFIDNEYLITKLSNEFDIVFELDNLDSIMFYKLFRDMLYKNSINSPQFDRFITSTCKISNIDKFELLSKNSMLPAFIAALQYFFGY